MLLEFDIDRFDRFDRLSIELRGEDPSAPRVCPDADRRWPLNMLKLYRKGSLLSFLPSTASIRIDAVVVAVPSATEVVWIEIEDIEDESLSSPFEEPNRFDAVELCLFFFGGAGKIFPGNSFRRFLCSFKKSPYLRPVKYGSSPFFLTLRINS